MKRILAMAVLAMVLATAFASVGAVQATGTPEVKVASHYYLNRYGFGLENITVTYTDSLNVSIAVPDIVLGVGSNLSGLIAGYRVSGSGYSVTESGGNFTVSGGGQALQPGGKSTFVLAVAFNGVSSTGAKDAQQALFLTSPAVSIPVDSYVLSIGMPTDTTLSSNPANMTVTTTSGNITYSHSGTTERVLKAAASMIDVVTTSTSDYHPLKVFTASRVISVGSSGEPVVTDSFTFENMGNNTLSTLYIAPLLPSDGQVTTTPTAEPRLISPTTVTLSADAITLSTTSKVGSPVAPGSKFTISYEYPLESKYYTSSGGVLSVNIPDTPPIAAFVTSFTISTAFPSGVRVVSGSPLTVGEAGPLQSGKTTISYSLKVGWAVGDAVPGAALLFLILLGALFVSRVSTSEEETVEESSTELASAMIKAFEEKTTLLNGIWPEIEGTDPNDLDKDYFDEVRARLDTFRSRALQRLNDVKQKSTNQKFFDLLSQIHTTEREVDRAAKDKLNLYEQYYMRRMKKEVFEKLLPQYTRRLERALNQLSDQLHVVQKEAKLL